MNRVECISGPMEYTCGYKYQIRNEMRFRLPKEFDGFDIDTGYIALRDCVLTIRRGYAYNGASGPTFDTKNSMRPTAFHDAMYQLLVEQTLSRHLKPLIDELFQELLRQDGMSAIRSAIWHRGVDRHGTNASIRNRNIMVAP